MSTEQGRQYGLILPKKGSGQDVIQRPAVFDEGSDSGESGKEGGDWLKKSFQREALKAADKRQIHKALTQDPTIFQYDEVYDDIKVNKAAPKKEEKKQSRYIQSLKRHAERRKLENERRLERQVQKERQAEGEEFKDKETFVTSSYKKKLEEFQKLEEEEKRMDRLEEIGDVSKQKDISGFYRHLYKTTVDAVHTEDKKDQGTGNEKESGNEFKINKSPNREATKDHVKSDDISNTKQKRQYRKRTKSGSSKEEGEKTSSSSSSSSYSSSSSSDSEEDKLKEKKRENVKLRREKSPDKKKISLSLGKENLEGLPKISIPEDDKEKKKKKTENTLDNDKQKNETTKHDSTNETKKVLLEPVTSVNIWIKRTVGENFDEALRRYLERKSKRQVSC